MNHVIERTNWLQVLDIIFLLASENIAGTITGLLFQRARASIGGRLISLG